MNRSRSRKSKQYRPLTWRSTAGFFGTLAIVIAVLVGYAVYQNYNHAQAIEEMTTPSYAVERNRYELAIGLSNSPKPVPAADLAVIDGELYVYRENSGENCWQGCVLIQPVDGGYAVTLPAVFRPVGHNSDLTSDSLGKVVELTYWNQQLHEQQTITSAETVALPSALTQQRTVEDLQPGDIAYVLPAAVRWTDDGLEVANIASAWYEPQDDRLSGMTTWAGVYRTDTGLEVCMPADYDPSVGSDTPTRVHDNHTIIYTDEMDGTPATFLSEESCQ